MQEIYKGRIVHLRLEEVTLPNGVTITLEIVRHPGASAVVAVDGDDCIRLLRQFRHAAGGYIWEIPAGVLHPDEAPAECAARELREETGLAAQEIVFLGSIVATPGFCDERVHLFLARGLSEVGQQLDFDEVISVERVALADALEMIRKGEIQDAKSIAALHHTAVYLNRERGIVAP